ncbi:STT3 domain-containing protein [Halobacteriaceae archaeon GCM10025711]
MSEGTEQVEEPSLSLDSVLERLRDWYHVPALAIIVGFMLWIRGRNYENFIQNGQVYFSGNDAWYHLREISYTVRHWPQTMPYDPWTGFPVGSSVGQFGTLYDQIVATAALIVGLGSPSDHTVALTLLFTPVVFGALIAVPVYFMGKLLGRSRLAGVFAALVLALLPGLFLGRSIVGAADHNIAEPFFQSIAVLAMMVALVAAERDKPIYEQVIARDFSNLRSPLGWSALAGFAMALYLWTWPPAVLLTGIFGAFFLVKLLGDYYRGASPEHVAFVAVVSMSVAGVLSLGSLQMAGFSATHASLLQPFLAFAVAVGAAFMAWLAREWDDRDLPDSGIQSPSSASSSSVQASSRSFFPACSSS